MKRIRRIFEAIVGLMMCGCAFIGIILMMCECGEWHRQIAVSLTGFVLFCIGVVPGVVISLMARRKEYQNGDF